MKSFTTVYLILVGLIAACTARTIEVGDRESSSSEELTEFKELIEQIETACYEKTGSSQAFEAMVESFTVVPFCFYMLIDGEDFEDDLERLKVNASTRHEFFPKYCPQIRNALACLDPPIKELSKCLDEDEALILRGTYNATPEALDLICANDGEILFPEGASLDGCMKNYSNFSEECAQLVSNSTNIMTVSKYGEVECAELAQGRDCLKSKFDECNAPRLMDVLDVFWRAVFRNSPCTNLITGLNKMEEDKAR